MSRDERIYQDRADMYETLISHQPSLANVIHEIRPYRDQDVADLGAGTGRLTLALADAAKSVVSLDSSPVMLQQLEKRLQDQMHANCRTAVADHRQLPLEAACVDLVVAGWSLCYLASNNHADWQANLQQMLAEIDRILRPGGTAIIFETLGTGYEEPVRYDFLQPYFHELEHKYGFQHESIRMDYKFRDAKEAESLTRYFFGAELADKVAAQQWGVVPEFAGVWYKHKK
ncbi:class I SAM-dependent methyltransferase [Paenibacillus aestuarii]|uniref:Class I SAM-dependent methyltransferase n=1 Tax=Paenibacillus aestuarii TaxID=516965 RepID=A0ABW0KBP2_9BACL|nr:class I SAM-dependent methyltransferase [Paenibacillus aestuarii]